MINFLKIPNEEISSRTYILVEFIVYIKNKDYGQIKIKAHFNGFIHSISDEYDFHLEFLLAEYDAFYDTTPPTENKLEKKYTEKEKETKPLFVNEKEKEENKINNDHYLIIIIAISVVVLVMSWFIFKDDKATTKKVLVVKQEVVKKEPITDTKKIEKIVFKKK